MDRRGDEALAVAHEVGGGDAGRPVAEAANGSAGREAGGETGDEGGSNRRVSESFARRAEVLLRLLLEGDDRAGPEDREESCDAASKTA